MWRDVGWAFVPASLLTSGLMGLLRISSKDQPASRPARSHDWPPPYCSKVSNTGSGTALSFSALS